MSRAIKAISVQRYLQLIVLWMLPVVALVLAAWIALDAWKNAPVKFEIVFINGEGLIPGKTKVKSKGIDVGVVSKLKVTKDLQSIIAVIKLKPNAKILLRKNTDFWLVKPEISLTRISGLSTLLRGNYIVAKYNPGPSEYEDHFVALARPLSLDDEAPGIGYTLISDNLSSLAEGSPVLYRQLTIGHVVGYKLSQDKKHIEIRIKINKEYADLFDRHAYFWNVSGLDVSAGLSGIEVKIGSIQTLISGGVSVDFYGSSYSSRNKQVNFVLYKDRNEAKSSARFTLSMISAKGIYPGRTKITYRGINIGQIETVTLNSSNNKILATAAIFEPYHRLLTENTSFSLGSVDSSGSYITGLIPKLLPENIVIYPGKGKPKFSFELQDYVFKGDDSKRLILVLQSKKLGSVSKGSAVYYREINVGEVMDFNLSKDASNVQIKIAINPPFTKLVYKGTKFWSASGIDASFGLFEGLKFSMESVDALLRGGIAFATPEGTEMGSVAMNGNVFTLHDKLDPAWLDWNPSLSVE